MTRIGFGLLAALMLATTVAGAQQPPAPSGYRSPKRAAPTLTACALECPPVKGESRPA